MTIYIGNLSFQAEQEHLFDLFSEYGEVKNCSLPLDRETGRKRGFAFVEMVNDACHACKLGQSKPCTLARWHTCRLSS